MHFNTQHSIYPEMFSVPSFILRAFKEITTTTTTPF